MAGGDAVVGGVVGAPVQEHTLVDYNNATKNAVIAGNSTLSDTSYHYDSKTKQATMTFTRVVSPAPKSEHVGPHDCDVHR